MNKNFIRLVTAMSIICFKANYFMLGELQKILRTAQTPPFDFHGQWALCAYTLRGIDPYPIIGLTTPTLEDIGIIPAAWSTTPWGLILGNFFYPGFMTLDFGGLFHIVIFRQRGRGYLLLADINLSLRGGATDFSGRAVEFGNG